MESVLGILAIVVIVYMALSLLLHLLAWAKLREDEDIEDRAGERDARWYDSQETRP